MFSSLRFRLWLTYMLMAGIVISVSGIVMIIYLIRNPANDRRDLQRLRLVAGLLANRGTNFLQNLGENSSESAQKVVERIDSQLGVRTAVFGENGELLADSRRGIAGDLPDWVELSSLKAFSFRDARLRPWLFVLTPMRNGDFLVLAQPRIRPPIMVILQEEVFPTFGKWALLAFFLSLLLAAWISNWVSAPLKRMAEATQEISAGNVPKVKPEGPREVRDLANSFNEMGKRVQASQKSQQDFVANVSHDLKTPLTSIQGFAQAIMDGTVQGPDAVSQAAGVIYDEAGRMHRMVMDLLELARFDSGMVQLNLMQINLRELWQEVIQNYMPIAKRNQIRLVLDQAIQPHIPNEGIEGRMDDEDLSEKPPLILGDIDRLRLVFSNLIENGLKFTPKEGQIQISIHIKERMIESRIEDSGPGIPPEDLERVFERFYQIDKSRSGGSQRGVGLGLPIAREIILAHGGSIFVENKHPAFVNEREPGTSPTMESGCIFTIQLPLTNSNNQIRPELPTGDHR